MRISSVRSTYCFVATGDRLAQVIRVVVADATPTALAEVSLVGEGLQWAEPWRGCLDPTWTGRADGPAWVPSADAGLGTPARFTSAPNLPDGVVVEVPVRFDPALPSGSVVAIRAVVQSGEARAEAGGDVV